MVKRKIHGANRFTRWSISLILFFKRRVASSCTYFPPFFHPVGEAKFWLTPEVHLANSIGLSKRQLLDAKEIIQTHIKEIHHAWNTHFSA
ncbi:DUF4160 domain-containing protein [Polaromonas vacuolata]|uniref:DUF4160 domain-containing protein n=1 Tax=Polaromonas vacuolata TaxID=37448 RepID=UPI003B52A552